MSREESKVESYVNLFGATAFVLVLLLIVVHVIVSCARQGG